MKLRTLQQIENSSVGGAACAHDKGHAGPQYWTTNAVSGRDLMPQAACWRRMLGSRPRAPCGQHHVSKQAFGLPYKVRRGTYAAGLRGGSTANCRAALPPIMRAISGS